MVPRYTAATVEDSGACHNVASDLRLYMLNAF